MKKVFKSDSIMSKWVRVESRSELHIGWRSWLRNCETMEVIFKWRSWLSWLSWLHDLLKGWAFVVPIIVKCCIQRKSFATPWTATMAWLQKCPKQPVIELLQAFKRQTYSMQAEEAEENHKCFSIHFVAGCSGTQPRISRPWHRSCENHLLKNLFLCLLQRVLTRFASAKLRCPSDESHCDQAQSIICCGIQLLQEILDRDAMHERHIVYVDYVSRSYQIEECRIS